MNYPPLPFFPEPLRGKAIAQIRGAYCGPIEQGEALLKFWRDWQAPLIDDFAARPFSDIAKVSNDPVDPMPGLEQRRVAGRSQRRDAGDTDRVWLSRQRTHADHDYGSAARGRRDRARRSVMPMSTAIAMRRTAWN